MYKEIQVPKQIVLAARYRPPKVAEEVLSQVSDFLIGVGMAFAVEVRGATGVVVGARPT